MLRKILSTIITRYAVAFLNLLLIFINGKMLGTEGMGIIGVVLASTAIVMIVNSIFCGNNIVYFMNRTDEKQVLAIAYLWALIGSMPTCLIMYLIGLLPEGYAWHILGLSILMTLVTINSRFHLGRDNMKGFNLTFLLQGGLLFFFVFGFYYIAKRVTVLAYIDALFITNFIAFAVSFVWLILKVKEGTSNEDKTRQPYGKLLKRMFIYGLWSSTDNLAENLTTRVNYFLIQRMGGYGLVGLLDAGTRISESVWHLSRSVSFIGHSSVARTDDKSEQTRVTLQLFKITFLALLSMMLAIVFIPEWFYTQYLFTEEFQGIRLVILSLAPGIVALGSNSVIGHYFIGSGQIKISAFCSCIGLIILVITGIILIPLHGVIGAAITSSVAYSSMLLFSIGMFIHKTGTPFRTLFPNRKDWKMIQQRLKRKNK